MNEDWWHRAACRGLNTDLFFNKRDMPEAVAICRICPVRKECDADRARTMACGVWGGRLYAHVTLKPFMANPQHGTPAGYARHMKLSEEVCVLCREANALSRGERKRSGRGSVDNPLPSEIFDWDSAMTRFKTMLDSLYGVS